ncbi:MAG TPA: protease modulator HflK [Vicinamibacterales bacterium]|jgi:membrane protease subunit HflK
MRRAGPSSEIARLVAPVGQLFDAAWQRMHWWIAAMAVLYGLSGITIVRADEVAVVLRWGRLVGATPALQQRGPGLLFALPKPIDEVVRVQVKHVWEVPVSTLAPSNSANGYGDIAADTLDPLTEGYALTGDHNIVQAAMVARYRVSDPGEWAFYGPKVEDVLRVEVTSAMVRSLGEMGVDRILSDGRKALVATVTRRVQAGLDAAHAGIELTSFELTRLAPPSALAGEFDAVQSAFIQSQTAQNDAQAFAQSAIPTARAEADAAVQAARGEADSQLATARGDTDAFRALDREYRANAAVVRERLYRDAIEKAIAAAGTVRWIPPPAGGSYHGFRLSITAPGAGYHPGASPGAGDGDDSGGPGRHE